ncbi:Toll-like receptor 9 [Dissostichus eleginoides]|uniref:Toll-like receptor 9 n=1 Tax=Dissostichus eleginoides TaxID=100907 RepID=A0AAD9CK70_DISEL|nr:Toll-like receptor 9 [Dissostichus eleginoides]
MATSAVLRVILGENSSQRVVLPDTVTELENEIRRQCQLQDLFRLQFMDELSGNIFQDLTSMDEIQDRATVKVLSLRPVVAGSCDNGPLTPTHVPNHAGEPSSVSPADTTVMLSSQESINAEFKPITTIPLQSKFLSQLDLYSANLLKMFESTTGQKGKKLKALTNNMDTDDIDAGRDLLIKGLCLYLNEDPGDLVQEFIDVDETIFEGAIEKTAMGIFTLKNTASEDDVRIVLEGVTVIQDLETVAFASAMLLGLIYSLNLSYPKKLSCTFEVLQKIIMELDGGVLSYKAQSLKTKLHQCE